jgi:hypothetical protein
MRNSFKGLFVATALLLPLHGEAHSKQRPVQLSVRLPRARGEQSTLTGGNYTIALQLRVPKAVALVDDLVGGEAIVIKDPDNCIDMSHFSSIGPFETCPGGPDESFIAFRSERTDQPAQFDVCTQSVRERLVDDEFDASNILNLNKPYLIAGNVSGSGGSTDGILVLRPVGAFTGGTAASPSDFEDCYGFASDDDVPGLVLMADVGPLRVFDENFDLVGSRIRNFAGMLNSVTIELFDRHAGSSIMAFLRVPEFLLEPITLVDRSIADPNVNLMTRRDSGPVQSFTLDPPPGNKTEEIAAILATYPEIHVTVRAVVVEGQAPDFIDDLDGNGRYTARDVEIAGYVLLSNEETFRIHAIHNDVLSEPVPFVECPVAILPGDLDGNGLSGYSCNTGNARSIKRLPP